MQYLLVQLEGKRARNVLELDMWYKFSALDTDAPKLELEDGTVWRGQYEEILGSAMIFEGAGDDAGYQGCTQLRLVFRQLPHVPRVVRKAGPAAAARAPAADTGTDAGAATAEGDT
mmetsp:Transcript_10550/g.26809  ORF Transcript_10550/g.26809 Transcript_10550/m.26809 type:complete len:116 (+) Transcript_10550:1-348(+)